MNNREKILRSLNLAGVEWELDLSKAKPFQRVEGQGLRVEGECVDPSTLNPPPSTPQTLPKAEFAVPKAAEVLSDADILETARRLAAADDLVGAIRGFVQHPLYAGARNTVLPHGGKELRAQSSEFRAEDGSAERNSELCTLNSALLVITDIPSQADDAAGAILSGPEGELFDKMMAAIGLSRDRIAITPLVFWRPPGGRSPTADELSFCRPFIDRIIKDVGAARILTLGALAAKEIAGLVLPRDHGKAVGNVIATYKPDFIAANPGVKGEVWAAIRKITS